MYQQIIQFWFQDIEPKQWFAKDSNFDQEITRKFKQLHQKANAGELFEWRNTALGSLAEIIVLDQFSRNIYRDQANAFAFDNLALALAQTAIKNKFDCNLPTEQRAFFYLPFMHSESQLIHQQAITLYQGLGETVHLEFELKHKRIIDRFGRYPHRNKILGRTSTAEEIEFLTMPNSSF